MIYYAVFITFMCLLVSILYLRQQIGLKHLLQSVQEKRETNTNKSLTTKTYSRSFDRIIQEFNRLFLELQALQITSQQEKATLDLAIHNITHDIRTPLTIANGYLYQLKKTKLSEEEAQIIQKIDRNLKTVADRLEVLLEYQNLLENNVKPELVPLDFSQFFKRQLVTYYDSLTKQKFSVKLDITEDLWIENDPELLVRILQNIFSNVLKHGRNTLTIRLQQKGKFAQLSVMNESKQPIRDLERLTTRFYSENLAEIEDSSGLGLFIVQELMTLSHGYLELASEGRKFELTISWPVIE
ncbi:HAMP domain-containing sensor histidine kinase [Enterococcus sp.]|uniref:sensor histidine kinase n=1 Tax=Enterococcus sp. TaxID=35783 RepID=UPI0025BEFF50|nr:HAMP domain-containing sensor histidine kinase [Enterococcus sp.]